MLRFRNGRALPAFKRAMLTRRNGRWYALLEHAIDVMPLAATGRVTGADVGVAVLATCSDGFAIPNPRVGDGPETRMAQLQRAIAAATRRLAASAHARRATIPPARARRQCSARLRAQGRAGLGRPVRRDRAREAQCSVDDAQRSRHHRGTRNSSREMRRSLQPRRRKPRIAF